MDSGNPGGLVIRHADASDRPGSAGVDSIAASGDDGDYQALLEEVEYFLHEPAEALFLPRRVSHVGTQDTFSVSMALPLYTYPHAQILQSRIIRRATSTLLGKEEGELHIRNRPEASSSSRTAMGSGAPAPA
jgi:hypothetical protein